MATCRVVEACEKVSLCGEQVVLCLEEQIWQHNRATETRQEIAGGPTPPCYHSPLLTSPFLLLPFFPLGAFKLGLRRIVHLRRECDEMKRYIKEMKLAEHNIDATPSSLSPSSHLQSKQRAQRDFTVPGSNPVPHALSYEDLRRDRDHQLSSKRSVDSFTGLRKAKSDTDVALQSLRKKVEVRRAGLLLPPFSYHPSLFLLPFTCTSLPPSFLPFFLPFLPQSLTVDNTKLRDSEKKLLKEKIKLTRQCKVKDPFPCSYTPILSYLMLHAVCLCYLRR